MTPAEPGAATEDPAAETAPQPGTPPAKRDAAGAPAQPDTPDAAPRTPSTATEEPGAVTPAEPGAATAQPAAETLPLPGTPPAKPDAVGASAEPDTPDATPRTPSTATEEPGGGTRVGMLLTLGLTGLIVLVLALATVLGVQAWNGRQAEEARGEAAAAGRKAAETALSYDYRTLDKSFEASRATMTPEFAAKFDDTAKVAGELATKTKATVRAEVREVGVRDGDANRVTLVIFVNQTTTSTITQGKPRVDLNRTRFTMVRNGDQWLVQEIAGL